jgi:hypothetical protein
MAVAAAAVLGAFIVLVAVPFIIMVTAAGNFRPSRTVEFPGKPYPRLPWPARVCSAQERRRLSRYKCGLAHARDVDGWKVLNGCSR